MQRNDKLILKHNRKNEQSCFKFQKNSTTFATLWFHFLYSGKRIKRETGVNPVQSRCCKLHKRFEQHFCHWLFGKAFKNGSKSEDLPIIINFQKLSRKKRRNIRKRIYILPLLGHFRELFERFIHRQIVYNCV